MGKLARVVKAEAIGNLAVRLTFSDGLQRDLDLDPVLQGAVFEQLRDPLYFATVTVDEVAGTVVWPNGVDLDPDVLHGDYEPASGAPPAVRAERRLRPSA
jgi:hypothetical protein